MPDFISRLTSLRLPSWMDKGESNKLLRVCRTWWQWVHSWLIWPLNQLDAATCAVPLLNVLAYQRDISRFNGEPLSLYRKRVQYALINAADAGSIAGFIAIFERLGIGYVELLERQPDIDWDVILVRVSDSQIASNSDLLMQIIRQYGKTCRRYRFEVITYSGLRIRAGWVGHEYVTYCARSDVANGNTTVATTFSASLTGKK